MEESLSKFITAILAIIIMFIFPVYVAYEKKDDISYALAVRYTQEFVDKVRSKGYITQELYQDYAARLLTTGNTYDIEMEHKYVRFDPNENTAEEEVSASRSEEIYSTEHILNFMDTNGKYVMNVDDNFNIKIKNTNVTMATVIYNIVTVNMSKNNVRIYVDYGGKILADKWWGSIDFFQGGEDIDYTNVFSTLRVEAYRTLENAESEINAIKNGEKVIFNSETQKIYYKVRFSAKPYEISGVEHVGSTERGFGNYVEEGENYKIYEKEYSQEAQEIYATFTTNHKTDDGENITKTANSPKFSLSLYKEAEISVAAYKTLEDAKNNRNSIKSNETITITSDKKPQEIYYKVTYTGTPRNLNFTVEPGSAGTGLQLNKVGDYDGYYIYKCEYNSSTEGTKAKVNAEFSGMNGNTTKTATTVSFNIKIVDKLAVSAYINLSDAYNQNNNIVSTDKLAYFGNSKIIYVRTNVTSGVSALFKYKKDTTGTSCTVETAYTMRDITIYKITIPGLSNEARTTYEDCEIIISTGSTEKVSISGFSLKYNKYKLFLASSSDGNVNVKGIDEENGTRAITSKKGNYADAFSTDFKVENSEDKDKISIIVSTKYDEKENKMKVIYTLKNGSDTDITVTRFSVQAPLALSYLEKPDGNNVIRSYSDKEKEFYFSVDEPNDFWVGNLSTSKDIYYSTANRYYGKDITSATMPKACSFSWNNIEIKAGESVTRSFTISNTKP